MTQSIDYKRAAPAAFEAMRALERYIHETSIEPTLIELVKIRASQLNGCAYCLDMHTKDARAAGETEQRLYLISTWREAPVYTPRERAALAWTETLTLMAEHGVPDEALAAAREQFGERELVELTMVVITINGWNRLSVAFRTPVGTYQPRARGAESAAR